MSAPDMAEAVRRLERALTDFAEDALDASPEDRPDLWEQEVDVQIGDLRAVLSALTQAQARIVKLERALTFYANREVYKPHPHGPAFDDRDISFVARAALSPQSNRGESHD